MLVFLTLAMSLQAQENAGSIRGVVHDSQGAVVPNAKVSLINQLQGSAAGEATSDGEGAFLFNGLYSSTYEIRISASGFKVYDKKDIVLRVGDNIGLPAAVLEVGASNETVTVQGTSEVINTVSAERTDAVSTLQLTDIASSGRSYTDFLRTVAGAPPDNTSAINGTRSEEINYALDGTTFEDSGCNCGGVMRMPMDSISEMKVATDSQGAEYGRSSGATVAMVSKAGSNQFHGGAYLFKQGEWMDANSFVNNEENNPLTINRKALIGYDFGGPIYIPHKWNTNKDKLFFFGNNEITRSKGGFGSVSTEQYLYPTAAEKTGNFAGVLDNTGKAVTVTDPSNNGAPFPGNIIPSNRINPLGQALLNYLPLPNQAGALQTNVAYNNTQIIATSAPYFDQVYRVDYNITQNERFFVRHIHNNWGATFPCGSLGGGTTTCLPPYFKDTWGDWGFSASLVSIIRSNITNEFLFGDNRNYLPVNAPASGSPYYKSKNGVNLPLLFPNADPTAGLIANFNFGNNSPSQSFDGLPYWNENPIMNLSDNFTIVKGTHTIKLGFFYENAEKTQTINADANGSYNFAPSANNPLDSGWGYANALLGNFNTFDQTSSSYYNKYRYFNYEWYAEDVWKARPNLTLTLGMRFVDIPPSYEMHNKLAIFEPQLYTQAQAVSLYEPALSGGQEVSKNPLTGAIGPSTLIGLVVPGSGNALNGMEQAGSNGLPRGLYDSRGVNFAPRLGVAWQPFGEKTVIRAGFGIFYERLTMNPTFQTGSNPPLTTDPYVYYSNFASLASSTTVSGPLLVSAMQLNGNLPTTMNWNIGVQRALPGNMTLDVSYVGSGSRHLATIYPINAVPFGAAWLPKNQSPCPPGTTCSLNGLNALPPDFMRPYIGYTDTPVINNLFGAVNNYGTGGQYHWDGTSNYDSLQVSLKRRLSRRLQFGTNFVWSKALDVEDGSTSGPVNPLNVRHGSYGPAGFNRTYALNIDYVYMLPGPSQALPFLNNSFGKTVFDGWELSGMTTFTSGAPISINFDYIVNSAGFLAGTGYGASSVNEYYTGSPDFAPRIAYTCKPVSNASIYQYFNNNCLAAPPVGSVGMDSGANSLTGPGWSNWDMSLFKNFQPWKDKPARYLQLRLESYNAFNHPEFNAVNTGIALGPGNSILDLPSATNRFGFGALSGTRSPRSLQLAAKIYF
jgi:hypothetical protein